MTSADAPAIELSDLGRAYGERVALSGVTLTLARGSTLAVFGANGAGKTTLLRILATLLRPHRGSARVFGHALPREGWAVRGRIGFLGHEPLLYRDLSARENLRYHARLHGVPGARVGERCDLIFTTGGTGLTPNDLTPEATRAVIERDAPGFAEAMRAEGLKHTPHGILTRGVSGIAGHTLIVNFPGSPKSIDQLFPVLAPTLEHVVRTLRGDGSHRTG